MGFYNRIARGKLAEQEACDYLKRKGFTLLKKNYHCALGEIDLIMQDQDDIVFIEVRLRSNDDHVLAIESVDEFKIRKLIRTASFFLQQKGWSNKVYSRFDVISFQGKELEWIKNAFEGE